MIFDSRDYLFYKEFETNTNCSTFGYYIPENDSFVNLFKSNVNYQQIKSIQINNKKNFLFFVLDGRHLGLFDCQTNFKEVVELGSNELWDVVPLGCQNCLTFHTIGNVFAYERKNHPDSRLVTKFAPRVHGVDINPSETHLVHIQWDEIQEVNVIHLSEIIKDKNGYFIELKILHKLPTDYE